VVALALFCGAAARGQDAPAEKPPTPLEFWHDGNDVLSARLAEQIAKTFAHSTDFVPASGRKPGTLLVELTANVVSKPVGRRAKVSYTVNFSNAQDVPIGTSDGSCWSDQLSVCAGQILRHALAARSAQ
jgi:hypothetical protein